jgi:hypothetical protein
MGRFIWTVGAVALGIAWATVKVGDKTPWQLTLHAWHQYGSPAEQKLQGKLSDSLEDAKDQLVHSGAAPHEHHSDNDRTALNKLIAGRAQPPHRP